MAADVNEVRENLIEAAATLAAAVVAKLPALTTFDPGFLTDPCKLTDAPTMNTNIAAVRLMEIFYADLVASWNTKTGLWAAPITLLPGGQPATPGSAAAALLSGLTPEVQTLLSGLIAKGTPATSILSALSGIGNAVGGGTALPTPPKPAT